MSNRIGASFAVRFLRNGDQVVIERNVINRNGVGTPLYQSVDPTSGVVHPSWDATGKTGQEQQAILDAQPIIQLSVRSSAGYPAEIKGVTWAFDGTTLNFVLDGSNWVTASNDSRFQARINTGKWELKITGDIASKTVVANKQISYEVSYVSNAMSASQNGSTDILIQAAGSDSHVMEITTDRVTLDAEHTSAHLTALGYYGGQPVTIGQGGYTVKWFSGNMNNQISGQTTANLTVTRDMVESSCVFLAALYLDNEIVSVASIEIDDVADEWQLVKTPTSAGSNYVGIGHNAVYNLSVTRNNTPYTGAVTFSWEVYNALGEKTFPQTGRQTGPTVTILPSYCMFSGQDGDSYGDCTVDVIADFNT